MDVVASDPAPGAEDALRRTVDTQWPVMAQVGLSSGASKERLRFTASPEDAVADVGFVQESGPERLDVKRELFRRLDQAAPPDIPFATSASTIMISEFQDACIRHPERVVLGHPFNPPHLIPLVEVGGGKQTSPDAIERALNFYRAMGKHPIHLRREIMGHVANRLQAALWQEAFNLGNGASPMSPMSTPPSRTVPDCAGLCSGRSSTCICRAERAASVRCSTSRCGRRPRACGATSAVSRSTPTSAAA